MGFDFYLFWPWVLRFSRIGWFGAYSRFDSSSRGGRKPVDDEDLPSAADQKCILH